MESGDSGSGRTSNSVQPTSTQAELLALLQNFVHLVSSDAMSNLQDLQQFRTMIRQLCEKAPEFAQTLVTMIQEFSNGDVPQQESARLDSGANQSVKRKRASGKDLSYRPPKPAKEKSGKANCPDDLDQAEEESETDSDCPAEDLVFDGVQPAVLNAEDITAQGGNVELSVEVQGDGIDASRGVLSRLDQPEFLGQDDCVLERDSLMGDVLDLDSFMEDDYVLVPKNTMDDRGISEIAVDKNKEGSIGAAEATSASNEAERRRPNVASEPMPHIVSSPSAPADMAPVTPVKQMEGELASPPTEEIHREKIPTSLESVSSSPRSITGSSSTEATSLMDMILEAARTIHQFSKYPHGVPREVHMRILQTFRNDHQEAIGASNLSQWSDGSTWIQVLDMGSSANQKVTILNMLEYMGAWEWYDRQVELSQATIHTKRNKLVARRGAATHVLDRMQGLPTGTGTPEKWISGIGRVALGKEEDESDHPPESCDVGITERNRRLRRKRITMQLSRGQKLTRLVDKLGLGILFSSKIWESIKKDVGGLDAMIRNVEADSKRMQLLHILGRQLEQLINKGHPDLHAFYDALKKEKLVSEEEFQELHMTFALDGDAMPKGTLDAAVDRLTKDVSTKVLGKRRLEDNDVITLGNGVELSYNLFHRLRQGIWFNNWAIMTAMQISDRPPFVRYGYSVSLDESGRKGRVKPIKTPLAGWAREISILRQKAKDMGEDAGALVHFRPLYHNLNHFSLLEINDEEKQIRHYDSMAGKDVIEGTAKPTRVAMLVQQEFGHWGYAYSEAPTPQQGDDGSCGVRVFWNYRRLSNNLPIGGWYTKQDPERMKMEIVDGLSACVEGNAMKRYRETPQSHEAIQREGLENDE